MQGLSDLAVAELLFCAQSIVKGGQRLNMSYLRNLAQVVRDSGAESVRALDRASLREHHRRFADRIVDELHLSDLTVEGQRGNDVLDLRAWGIGGFL